MASRNIVFHTVAPSPKFAKKRTLKNDLFSLKCEIWQAILVCHPTLNILCSFFQHVVISWGGEAQVKF